MTRQRILVLGCDDAIARTIATSLASTEWATPVTLASEYTTQHPNIECVPAAQEPAAYESADAIVAAFAGQPLAIRDRAARLFKQGDTSWRSKRVILLSSMTVYGEMCGDIGEHVSLGSNLSPYAAARVESERLADAYPNVVKLRLGVEYGPMCTAWSERVARWLARRRVGDLGALGDGYCNLVYIDDIANAVMSALKLRGNGNQVFNLAAPSPPTWNEYFLLFGKALGAVPVKRISRRRLAIETKIFAPTLRIAEVLSRLTGTSWLAAMPAIPPSALGLFAQEIKLNATRATSALELNWTSLDEGLKRTAHWLRSRE